MNYEEVRELLLQGRQDDGMLHTEAAVPFLVRALGDTDMDVQVLARTVLEKTGNAAIPGLMNAWENKSLDIIIKAAIILGDIVKKQPEEEQGRMVSGLVRDLDEGAWKRYGAACMLAEMGLRRVEMGTKVVCLLTLNRLDEIVMLGEPAMAGLLKIFRDDAGLRRRAARVLVRVGLDRLEKEERLLCLLYLDNLSGIDEYMRREIASGGERAVPGLVNALKDEDADIRQNAAVALGNVASVMEIDMNDIRAALLEYVNRVKEKGERIATAIARREAAGFYKRICAGVRKRLTEKYSGSDGVMLEGAVKPPSKGDRIYRQGQARAIA